MRVLLLTQQLARFRSGVGTVAHALVRGLGARGHGVSVILPEGEEIPDARCHTVPRPRLDPTPGSWIGLSRRFADEVRARAGRFDVALFTDAREAWRCRRPSLPTVGLVNDTYALDWLAAGYPRARFADRWSRALYYGLQRRVERATYPRLSGLLANSEHVARALTGGYGIAARRIRVVRLGLDDGPDVAAIELAGAPAILIAGGNFQRKGLPVLLQAAGSLLATLPGLRIHVVGSDRNQPAVEAEARRLGVREVVTFHGRVPNERVRGMMAGADLYAMPSWTEAWGQVYLEAMRAGAPVIATSAGGLSEVARDGEHALFVKPGDSSGLAEAIERIVRDGALRDRLRRRGLALSREFTIEAMSEAVERALGEVVG